jgi:putative ubiquitin-RnfH superfamily antitoxin RatB of RatAB toxin-antitoxin module
VADAACLAVFGRAATPATRLHAGDRIEILRPLLADPKQRRRERAGEKRR